MTFPARLLVVHRGPIGDVVDALAFATAVEEAHPEAHVGWVVQPLVAPLVQGHPCIERVHPWQLGGGLAGLSRVLRAVRRQRYELAVDLQCSRRSGLFARFSAPSLVRARERALPEESAPGGEKLHEVERALEVATRLGCGARPARHVLPRDPASEAWAESWLSVLGGAPILVHLGASHPDRRWAPEHFGELARALAEQHELPVCLTGGPADRVRVVAGIAISPRVHDFVGATTLPQFVALARRARLFVGGDTGPMHVAAALGTPVVALFGPSDPALTGPWGRGQRVLRGPNRRMEEIGVAETLACVLEELRSSDPALARQGSGCP